MTKPTYTGKGSDKLWPAPCFHDVPMGLRPRLVQESSTMAVGASPWGWASKDDRSYASVQLTGDGSPGS